MSELAIRSRPRWAARELAIVCGGLALILLVVAGRYGPHRDELYFVAAGRHLAWGYPDQPSFTPLLAWLAQLIAPGNLIVLRVPSILAVVGLVIIAAGFARLLGGGRAAQVLTATTIAASAVVIAIGHRLSTATFDTLAWAGLLLILGYLLVDRNPRLWLLAGAVAGIGLNNKHAVAILLVAILIAVALDQAARAQLRTPYPWLGGLIALLLWLPNLIWQATHGWPVRALSADIAEEYGGVLGRVAFIGQALVIFSPLISVVWIYGAVLLFRRTQWRAVRPVAVVFLISAVVFLITGGKGYYLAGAIVPLVAAGCTELARRWSVRAIGVAATVLAFSAVVAWPAMIPLLPPSMYASSFYPAIDQDQLETIGWEDLVATVRSAAESVPAEQRQRLVVITGNYGEAGALDWYGFEHPVYSGHNGYGDWGPPPDGAAPVIVVGRSDPGAYFEGCRQFATIRNQAGAENEEAGQPVWICAGPSRPWSELWPSLLRLRA